MGVDERNARLEAWGRARDQVLVGAEKDSGGTGAGLR